MIVVIKMVKVLFVCLGNICRSPMAEGLFRKRVKDLGLEDQIHIESRATSSWEIGNKPHPGTSKILKREEALYDDMYAQKITQKDFDDYDFIIGMDDQNLKDLRKLAKDQYHKVFKYLDVCEQCKYKNVDDPYYTGLFDKTYSDIYNVMDLWIEIFKKQIV
jgi:protein-tyrosine phosphatase